MSRKINLNESRIPNYNGDLLRHHFLGGGSAAIYGVQSVVAAKMSAAGIAGAATTAVTFLLPIAIGATAVAGFIYGPAIAATIKDKAVLFGTSVRDCFSGMGSSLKNCSLWSRPARPATSGSAPAGGGDLHLSLLDPRAASDAAPAPQPLSITVAP